MGINLNDKGYYDVPAANPGEFVKLPAGGYICRIIHSELLKSKSNNLMLVLSIDIAEGEFQGHFKTASANAQRFDANKKWDNSGIYRQLVFDSFTSKVSSYLKGLFTCIENSNDNFKININNFEPNSLCGKLCGFIFAGEEYEKRDHSIGVKTVIKFPTSIEKIRSGDFRVPELKKLSKPVNTSKPDKDFPNSEPIDPDDLPFL